MTVEKRDGQIVDFDTSKIEKAVSKAAKSVKVEISAETLEKLVKYVVTKVSKLEEPIKIEDIQNAVEDSLMKYNLFDVERSFHDYRKERDRERFKRFQIVNEMSEAIAASKVQNSNANMDEASFGGRKGTMDSAYLKEEALEYRMNDKHAKNHRNNRIYIHDLDSYSLGMHNCDSIPFDDLLSHEIITRQAVIRPAGSINTFFQLIAVGMQLQSLQEFGGVSATHIDWSAVPYFRKSLRKHYCVAMLKASKEFEELNLGELMFDDREEWIEVPYVKNGETGSIKKKVYINRLEEWIDDRKEALLKEYNLKNEDFYIGSDKLNKAFLQSALYDTIAETKQAVEGLLHNLNTLQSRSGNQLPFSSINYGTCTLPEGRIIIKAILDATIKGTGKGATSIFPCQIFQMKEGVNCKEGDPNYDLFKTAIRCTSKRMYPNYANCDWSVDLAGFEKSRKVKAEALELLSDEEKSKLIELIENNPELGTKLSLVIKDGMPSPSTQAAPTEIMSTMGCRTYNGFDINFTPEYFAECLRIAIANNGETPVNYLLSGNQKDGRGNIAPATIILPTLAMEAKRKAEKNDHQDYVVDYFMDILEKAISDCKDELIERFNWIAAQRPSAAAFMWQNNTMKGYIPERGIISALKHGTLAIGQLGVAEAVQILIGKDQTSPEGMVLAKRIEQLYNDKCREYKENYKLNFGVYYTPAESTCGTSWQKFTKKYGLMEGINAYKDENGKLVGRGYFTNSIHVPVWVNVSPYEKIDIESQLTGYSNAGCITYVEIGDNAQNNLEALEQIVLYAKAHDIPYFALNVRLSDCTKCGYSGFIDWTEDCPMCGANHDKYILDYARVTGYLSTSVKHFNKAKQMETKDRYVHVHNLPKWNQGNC